MIVIEPYLEWAISGIMNAKVFVTTYHSDRYAAFTGILSFIIAFIALPIALIKIYYVPDKFYRRMSYKKQYGGVFYDIRSR